ncbi:MAG: putative 2-hydroxyglutaryl-CoA dehydratase, partial [Streblomastix strix]
APNYLSCLRRALREIGCPYVPVIPLTTVNKFDAHHPGFEMNASLYREAVYAFVMGDLLQRLLLRTRPYERVKGSANELCLEMMRRGYDILYSGTANNKLYRKWMEESIHKFDTLPFAIDIETGKEMIGNEKPRVGIVGEIGVQLRPSLNGYVMEQLELQGAEAVCLGMIDFIGYAALDDISLHRLLRRDLPSFLISKFAITYINHLIHPIQKGLKESKRFFNRPFSTATEIVNLVEKEGHCSPLMVWGEGWLLVGEMVEMITLLDCPNILLLQPWGCLPNHITGANIVPIDFDTSASEVNQMNRITLMLSVAKDALKQKRDAELIQRLNKIKQEEKDRLEVAKASIAGGIFNIAKLEPNAQLICAE